MAAVCLASAKVCILRVARLDASCACVSGATNGAVSSAIIRLQASPDYETGEEFLLKNGCGDICVDFREQDRLKRMNLNLEICTRDLPLLELLTGGTIYTVGGDIIGFSRRGITAAAPYPVFLEIFTRAVDASGTCVDPDYRYWRIIYPKATFTLGESTFENGIATVQLSGYAEKNAIVAEDGCWNDISGLTLDADSPEHQYLTNSIPTAACGYTTVPVQGA